MAQSGSLCAETEALSQVLSLVEAFRSFDADDDGLINVAEVGGALSSLGYGASEREVTRMMQQGDRNRDGLVSIEEFLEMNTKEMELNGGLAESLRSAMEAFDEEGFESMTADDLNLILELSMEECQAIIESMDADGDGAVDFDDFKLIVASLL
ncbi:probable calcium-binding protein CML29 [Carica papaya]|uniref:Calmodulin-like protein 25.2 n=1 Tax=Carica papaya TaxID=3649 RepID=A0A3Q8UB65_CARPA|nr:probable calcium-binding protein CML29 [Carica papaya]AZL94078.1 calmodulin-like protein 25.2 [Carica papaya]